MIRVWTNGLWIIMMFVRLASERQPPRPAVVYLWWAAMGQRTEIDFPLPLSRLYYSLSELN